MKNKLEKIKPQIKDNKLYKQIEELKEVLDKHVKEVIELEFKNFELTGEMMLQNGGKLVRVDKIEDLPQNKFKPYLTNLGKIKEFYLDEMAEFLLNFDKTQFKNKEELKKWLESEE